MGDASDALATSSILSRFSARQLIVPYKDLVIEAKEIPEFSEDTPIIEVKDLEKLAKAAEILARPIFYIHNDAEHTFYVFDADMTYIYRKTEGKT